MKKTLITCLSFVWVLHGCLQQETVGDTTKREIDRQKTAANEISAQYDLVKGTFSGTSGASSIVLIVDTARQGSDGVLVPQPKLIGNLVFTPSILVDDSGQPMNISYPVTSGQFDGAKDLSFTIQQNGIPTAVHCTTEDLHRLDCTWYSSHKIAFTLFKNLAGNTSNSDAGHFGGEYVGENPNYIKIKAFFRAFLTAQNGSLSTPQLSIVGSFTFFPRPTGKYDPANSPDLGSAKFPFADGAYDPGLNMLVIRVNGDSPIAVNCMIKSSTELHCTWVGNHGSNNYEEFDLVKANAK